MAGRACARCRRGVLCVVSLLTVRTRPGDNLMVHAALNRAKPGDVLVIDAGGDLSNALMGELMLGHAQQIGVAGVVLNGAPCAISAGSAPTRCRSLPPASLIAGPTRTGRAR